MGAVPGSFLPSFLPLSLPLSTDKVASSEINSPNVYVIPLGSFLQHTAYTACRARGQRSIL